MKIRVLSDLHLEYDEPLAIRFAEADLVVLAGDIHNHAEGLRWAAENFDPDVHVVSCPAIMSTTTPNSARWKRRCGTPHAAWITCTI